MSPLVVTRAALAASWEAARKAADVNGVASMSPAAWCGYLLEVHGGDARAALAAVPAGEGKFWCAVREYIHELRSREAA